MNLRPIAIWFMIIAAESLNGLLRELFLEIPLGDRDAHQIGVVVGSALVFAITLATIRWMKGETTRWLLAIGAFWMLLTFTFEVVLSRASVDRSFEGVFADYDPRRGGLMLLGMAVLAFSPWVAARLLGIQEESQVRG